MKLISFLILVVFISTQTRANENEFQTLLDEIVATHIPSPENEAKLVSLFEHQDMGVRFSAKIRIAELYWKTGRFKQAESVLQEVQASYDELPPKFQIESLLTWASFELRRNNFREVEVFARQASEIAKSSYPKLLPNTYYILGNAFNFQKKLPQAKKYYELAFDIYEKADDAKGMFLLLNSLGVMYKDNGDLVNGIKYLLRARKAVERTTSKGYRASTYYNLGDVYLNSGEPNKAINYYQQALELDLELGDLGNAAYDYNGLAAAYMELNQYPLALQNNQQAIQLLLKINAPQQLSKTYLKQSDIYNKLNEESNQINSLFLAEKSAAKSKSSYQVMSVKINKAKYYLDSEQAEQALDELLAALDVAQELSLSNELLELNKLLANTYQRLEKHNLAYQFLSKSFELQQKLNTEDRREKSERYKLDVNLLEEQLKVAKLRQTEVQQAQALRQQESENQRLMILMIASILVFTTLAVLLYQRRKLALLKARLFEDALQQKQQLFADVSHELRTPLTALKLQIQALQYDLVTNVEDSYDKLAGKVNEINRLITDIYQLAQADTSSIELKLNDVELESTFKKWQTDWQSFVERSGFLWQSNIALAGTTKLIDPERIKQVIDNLLSNATIYTDKPGSILLTAQIQNEKLVVSVEDSAPTVSEDNLNKIFTRLYRVESSRSRQTGGSGLGLAICESLIKAHKGKITAEQSPLGGLKVTFTI